MSIEVENFIDFLIDYFVLKRDSSNYYAKTAQIESYIKRVEIYQEIIDYLNNLKKVFMI